jgi:ankyrin repeat protein
VPYILILRGATIDTRLYNGETPLYLATTLKDCIVLKFLLAKRANWRVSDNDGRTALHHAAMSRNCTAVRIFLDKKLDSALRFTKS